MLRIGSGRYPSLFNQSLGQFTHHSQFAPVRYRRRSKSVRIVTCSKDDEGKEGELNDIFRKELQKRNINSIDDIKEEESEPKRRGNVVPPPSFSNDAVNDPPPQLQRSRELNSEGLEGLIPRGSQLLQLGISFFLAFGPFILFVVISFTLLYGLFGDNFVHQGTPGTGPRYIDPDVLLNEPTVDPMIPM